MQKLFYLLFDDARADGARLRERICDNAVPALRASGAMEVSVFANDAEVAAGSPVSESDPPIRAMVSFWLHDAADRGPAEDALGALVENPIAGYLVLESRPMIHERPKGRRTKGMKQITCIMKRPDLLQEEFIRIWHEDHRKVAVQTQSTFGYVRNEIIRPLTLASSKNWSAIVEESFPIEALDDPLVFFDSKTRPEYEANLKRMMQSCERFMSLESLEVTFVSEYYLG
jgi:hypothetical protein